MKQCLAITMLLCISTVCLAQATLQQPCQNTGAYVALPDGAKYECQKDGSWKVTVDHHNTNRPDWLPAWISIKNGVRVVVGFVFLLMLLDCGFVIHTKRAGIVERFGKFNRIAEAGLNFKFPFVEDLVYTEDLAMQLMDVKVASKTKDDATVTIPVRVQYFVLPTKIKEAYYELDDPEDQIKAHVENVILSYVPTITLDDTYLQEDKIADRISESLTEVMSNFGYSIENALVTKIIPSDAVVHAMNDINAARREKIATEARAEANKLMLIATAQAEAEAKALQGQGVARERKAIVDGLKDSVENFEKAVHVDAHDVMALVMMTQYFDMMRDIGKKSNTILMPHSPSAAQDFYEQLRTAVTTSHIAADKARGESVDVADKARGKSSDK